MHEFFVKMRYLKYIDVYALHVGMEFGKICGRIKCSNLDWNNGRRDI